MCVCVCESLKAGFEAVDVVVDQALLFEIFFAEEPHEGEVAVFMCVCV